MVYKADKLRLRKLLMDAISLLCKNGLPVHSAFRIEATIGITLSEDEVVLVSFREVVQPDGAMAPQAISEDEASDDEASSALSHGGDDLDVEDDAKKAEDNNRSSQGIEDEGGTGWCESVDSSFVGNFDLKPRTAVAADNPNGSLPDVFPYDEKPRTNPSCSATDWGNRRSRSNVQIKDEALDPDEDCSFIKIEDGAADGVFDPLVPDDGWMYQVYNDSNLYSNPMGSELSQGQGFDETPVASTPNHQWTASPRDVVTRSSQPHRGGYGTMRGGAARSGVRHSLPAASRSQAMVMGLCQRIISESTLESTGRYLCHICQARLGSVQTLRNHIKKTHLAMKIERCRACGAAFRWASQLARHKKREHGRPGDGAEATPTMAGDGTGCWSARESRGMEPPYCDEAQSYAGDA